MQTKAEIRDQLRHERMASTRVKPSFGGRFVSDPVRFPSHDKRYWPLEGLQAIDEYPHNYAAWFNRACALTRWLITGGINSRWMILMQVRNALSHCKDLRNQ